MATHSSVLAWKMPWTEEPGGLPSMGFIQLRKTYIKNYLVNVDESLEKLKDTCGKQVLQMKRQSEVAQLCLTLSDPMDCSPPGSSIHGIFQARVLAYVY